MVASSLVAAQLTASQEGLSSLSDDDEVNRNNLAQMMVRSVDCNEHSGPIKIVISTNRFICVFVWAGGGRGERAMARYLAQLAQSVVYLRL
jgi:hypothetical protein